MAVVDGQAVVVGDTVGFKSDVEQSGEILEIKGNQLTLKSHQDTGFEGNYIGGNWYTTVMAADCWL